MKKRVKSLTELSRNDKNHITPTKNNSDSKLNCLSQLFHKRSKSAGNSETKSQLTSDKSCDISENDRANLKTPIDQSNLQNDLIYSLFERFINHTIHITKELCNNHEQKMKNDTKCEGVDLLFNHIHELEQFKRKLNENRSSDPTFFDFFMKQKCFNTEAIGEIDMNANKKSDQFSVSMKSCTKLEKNTITVNGKGRIILFNNLQELKTNNCTVSTGDSIFNN